MPLFGPPNVEKLKAKGKVKRLIYEALRDWRVHEAAVEALVEIGAPAVDPLIAALKDPVDDVRRGAAEALGKAGDERAVDPLITALRDRRDENIRPVAAVALGQIGNARAVEPLVAALKDKDKKLHRTAAAALGKIGAVSPLIAALNYPVKDVREAAAEALTELGTAAVRPLISALRNKDKEMREAAARILESLDWKPDESEAGAAYWVAKCQWDRCVEIGTPAIEPLIAALRDERVSGAAARALEEIGDQRAVEPLVTYWATTGQWGRCISIGASAVEPLIAILKNKHVSTAAWALGQIGDARAVESLIAALRDKNREVRKTAAQALGQIGDARAVESLIAALRDREVREAAAQALGQIGDTRRVVGELIGALSDPAMHRVAAAVLGQIGAQTEDAALRAWIIEPLIGYVASHSFYPPWRREAAAKVLGQIGDSRAVHPLIAALELVDFQGGKAENYDAKRAIVEALIKIGTPAVEPLIDILKKGGHWHLCEDTTKVLRAITRQDFDEDVDRWQQWWDTQK